MTTLENKNIEIKGGVLYVVTSGCYSDYGINTICSTRELAEQYISSFVHEDKDREEFDIEEYIIDEVKIDKGLKRYTIQISKDGKELFSNECKYDYFVRDKEFFYVYSDGRIRITILARNIDEARKSAHDLFIYGKAKNG